MVIEELITKLQEIAKAHPGIKIKVSVDDVSTNLKEVDVYRPWNGKPESQPGDFVLGLEG